MRAARCCNLTSIGDVMHAGGASERSIGAETPHMSRVSAAVARQLLRGRLIVQR